MSDKSVIRGGKKDGILTRGDVKVVNDRGDVVCKKDDLIIDEEVILNKVSENL
jgi:hypothetical protein